MPEDFAASRGRLLPVAAFLLADWDPLPDDQRHRNASPPAGTPLQAAQARPASVPAKPYPLFRRLQPSMRQHPALILVNTQRHLVVLCEQPLQTDHRGAVALPLFCTFLTTQYVSTYRATGRQPLVAEGLWHGKCLFRIGDSKFGHHRLFLIVASTSFLLRNRHPVRQRCHTLVRFLSSSWEQREVIACRG